MLQTTNFSAISKVTGRLFLAAGFFDGVHRGHQRVITAARDAAHAVAGRLWVLTFDAHPLKVLDPERAPRLLTSAEHKALLLEKLGVDGCLSLPFDHDWASLEPVAFLDRLRREAPAWSALYIGRNWRFGRNAAGDIACLRRWAAKNAVKVTAMAPVICRGSPVSSTRIRRAVVAGRLDMAARLLGRPFSLLGYVGRGRGMGRQLGFPTANVEPDNEVRPPCGVYAAGVALAKGQIIGGVLNIGVRPTFAAGRNSSQPVMEVHLLDAEHDLYGCRMEIFPVALLREERRFDSPAALREQVAKDVEAARRMLRKKLQSPCFTKCET